VDKQINSRNYLNASHIQNYWHLQTLPYNEQKEKHLLLHSTDIHLVALLHNTFS